MGIIRTGKIQSHGNFNELDDRITVLEDKYVRFLWFAEISSGTSGTITPPTGGTIVLDQWAAGIDAVTSTLTTTRNPTFESAKTSTGVIITATMASNGAWTISGTPSAYPIAILYVYDVKLISADRTKCLVELETNQGLKITDSPTFADITDSGLSASLMVVSDANKKLISGTNTNTDVADAVTKKHTQGSDTALGTVGTKNPPIDADLALYRDSAASNVLVTSTWTQVKAFLKTYFDTLYHIVGGTDIPVTDGGSGVSTLTDHGVLVGSGTDPVTALTVGTNGQVLVGSTGADPVFATVTDGEGIDTTLGAGALTIAAETASETNPGVIEIATDVETIAGSDTARAITASNLKAKLGTQTDGGLLVGAGQTAVVEALAAGATTEVLVGGGTGVNPVWTTATGSGAPVRATSPTLVAPALGAATCTTINVLTLTAQAVGFTIAGGTTAKTLTVEDTTLVNQDLTTDADPTFDTLTLTSGQIVFPATQVASAGANTLDDYEEGTWDITLSPTTSGTITLYSNQNRCSYTKIGNLVHCQGSIRIESVSSPVGSLRFSLPFTAAASVEGENEFTGVMSTSGLTFADYLAIYGYPGQAYFEIFKIATGVAWTVAASTDLDVTASNNYFEFSLTYRTA